MERTIQETLRKSGIPAKALAEKTGLNLPNLYKLYSGRSKFVKEKTANIIQAKVGIDLSAFIFNRKEQTRRWSKKARIRVKRRNAAKRAWESRKKESLSNGLLCVRTGAKGKCIVLNRHTSEVIGRGQIVTPIF